MNCVAVGRIAASGLFDEVSVPSAPGDSGTALGAAIAVHLTQAGAMPDGVAGACYLGPAYPVGPEGPEVGPRLQVQRIDEAAAFVADQLAGGAIVGVFQGRLEAGPRALGNRSILASPLVADVVERLNATVKFRESFRPFAPVVSTDAATTFFRLPQPSPFMSMAVPVTDLARERIPTIVAANGTSRVQTVTKEQNPFLARVIESFRARTRVPVLINTSLNVKGKPICGTPQMALECLAHSGLDGLLLEGRWWVTKAKKSELPLPVELDREQMENEAAGR